MKALFNVVITNKKDKKDTCYFNTATAVYMTHNFNLYIMLDLDNQTVDIKTANSIVFRIQSTGTIDLYVFVENKHMYIKLINVYYLPKLNANLILFGVFEEKGCKFRAVDNFLQIKNKKDNIVLELIRNNSVYLVQQPKLPA